MSFYFEIIIIIIIDMWSPGIIKKNDHKSFIEAGCLHHSETAHHCVSSQHFLFIISREAHFPHQPAPHLKD